MARRSHDGLNFWGWVVVRLLAIAVAGLAMIVLFNELMLPVLRGDVERIQYERAPRGPATVDVPRH